MKNRHINYIRLIYIFDPNTDSLTVILETLIIARPHRFD